MVDSWPKSILGKTGPPCHSLFLGHAWESVGNVSKVHGHGLWQDGAVCDWLNYRLEAWGRRRAYCESQITIPFLLMCRSRLTGLCSPQGVDLDKSGRRHPTHPLLSWSRCIRRFRRVCSSTLEKQGAKDIGKAVLFCLLRLIFGLRT